jgi:hypothetical protein
MRFIPSSRRSTETPKNQLHLDFIANLVPTYQIFRFFAPHTPLKMHVQKKMRTKSEPPGFFAKLFGGGGSNKTKVAETRTVKPRKAPIKIEPKVFFSNERTFLAWMHVSVILAGASIAILALSDYESIGKQMYGLIMLPVAVSFLVYAMYQCKFQLDSTSCYCPSMWCIA